MPCVKTYRLHFDSWCSLLPCDDKDYDFILSGVKNGFSIVDKMPDFNTQVLCDNYRSAMSQKSLVEKQIKNEIDNGNYVVTKVKPLITSAIGSVPKDNGSVRLIHDASMPNKFCLNSLVEEKACSYMDLNYACKLIKHNDYLCKVDLKNAYRCVSLHESNYNLTGLHWKFEGDAEDTYFYDTKLPFGASKSPSIFQCLSSAVCRIMKAKFNILVISYLDDFLIISNSYNECKSALQKLLFILRQLGFHINYSKIDGPAQKLIFLGVLIDTGEMTLSLPDRKLADFHGLLQTFQNKRRATKRQLESLIGSLNWASQVIQGGRSFMRRMIDLKNTLKNHSDKALLNSDFSADLEWWLKFMKTFNGRTCILDNKPISSLQCDACSEGGGATFLGDFFYINWTLDMPDVAPLHINLKETIIIVIAIFKWASFLENKRVIIYTDNVTAKSVINKMTSRNPVVMVYIRFLFYMQAVYNFSIFAIHIPGKFNTLADACSRLHEKDKLSLVYDLLPFNPKGILSVHELLNHMSFNFFMYRWMCGRHPRKGCG